MVIFFKALWLVALRKILGTILSSSLFLASKASRHLLAQRHHLLLVGSVSEDLQLLTQAMYFLPSTFESNATEVVAVVGRKREKFFRDFGYCS